MRATRTFLRRILAFAFLLSLCLWTNAQTRHYQLLDASTYLDDCAICDRLSIAYPMRGEFDLVLLSENSLFSRYALTNLHFVAGPSAQPTFKLTGEGELQIGGEVALLQTWVLRLTVDPHIFTNAIILTNSSKTLDRFFPNLSASCVQSDGTLTSTVYLEIKAAPVEEIWFLSRKPVGTFKAGDILSSRGRLVKSESELLSTIGITNPPPAFTLDALDIRTGYRFSVSPPVTETIYGPVSDGDFFSGPQNFYRPSSGWGSSAFARTHLIPESTRSTSSTGGTPCRSIFYFPFASRPFPANSTAHSGAATCSKLPSAPLLQTP